MNNLETSDNSQVRKLLVLASLAGQIMLQNGAETYRVEDTLIRICKSRKSIKYVDVFVVPTGIFISIDYKGELFSYIKRIKSISLDLSKVDMVNEFSRKFVNSDMTVIDGIEELKKINKVKGYSKLTKTFFGSLASAFFCILFGGSFLDFIASFLTSFFVIMTLKSIEKLELTFFINNFSGAILASLFSYLLVRIGIGENLDKIIIGSIMPLVPGVSITNSIRDTMSGDYLSGLSKGMEAIFAALAIALGVGIVLNFYFKGVF